VGFSDNNCNYQVLGAVLDLMTGQSYSELAWEALGRPLGLSSLRTTPDNASHGGTGVVGYDGKTRSPHMNFAALGAGGALTGTARDLLAFNRALLAGRLASPTATTEMWKGDPKLGYAALGAWSFEARLEGCPAPVRLIERRGHFAGIQVRNLIAPQLGRAIVAFTNDGERLRRDLAGERGEL
jgi:CubicO group peptidase (beta-lactamase class C family)